MNSMSDYNSISGNCRRGVLVCYTLGLLGGQSDGSFGPKNPMNRAQGCVVINRLRDYMGNTTETPVDPVDPSEPPEVTDGPLFKLQDGETAQQMMDRINASTTYTAGYLTNGKPITEDNIKELLAKFKESMPEGSPWYGGTADQSNYFYTSVLFGLCGGCNSYAAAVSDSLFGRGAPVYKHQNFDQLKVGDVVWAKNAQNGYDHVIAITSLYSSGGVERYLYTDAGGTQGVSWAGMGKRDTLNKEEVRSVSYIYSRY